MLSQHRRRSREKVPVPIVKRQHDHAREVLRRSQAAAGFFERDNLKLLLSQ